MKPEHASCSKYRCCEKKDGSGREMPQIEWVETSNKTTRRRGRQVLACTVPRVTVRGV